jgi:hypothetical protein
LSSLRQQRSLRLSRQVLQNVQQRDAALMLRELNAQIAHLEARIAVTSSGQSRSSRCDLHGVGIHANIGQLPAVSTQTMQ